MTLQSSTLPELLQRGYALRSTYPDVSFGVFEPSFFPRHGRGKPSRSHGLSEPEGWYIPEWEHGAVRASLFDPAGWHLAPSELESGPRHRDLEWFARGLRALQAVDPPLCQLTWRFRDELEVLARGKLTHNASAVRVILSGVTPVNVREEGFAALFVAVLKIARLTYVFFRTAGFGHDDAARAVERRLQTPQPLGAKGTARGVWLTNLIEKYTANHRTFYLEEGRRLVAASEELVARATVTEYWPWIFEDTRFGRGPDFVAAVLGHFLLRLHRREAPFEDQLAQRRAFKRQELARAASLVWRYPPEGTFDPVRFETLMPQAALLVRATFTKRLGRAKRARLAAILSEASGSDVDWVLSRLDDILDDAKERSAGFVSWLDDGLSRLRPGR